MFHIAFIGNVTINIYGVSDALNRTDFLAGTEFIVGKNIDLT
jgi:hypothetical protein